MPRFVNVVTSLHLPSNDIWKKIKTFRVEQLRRYSNNNFKYIFCFTTEELTSTVEKFAKFVGVNNISDEINVDLSKKTLEDGAEMFQSLYACPSYYVRLYLKAIYGNRTSTEMAILASKIVKKATSDFKDKAAKIFEKITLVLGYQYISHYNRESQNFQANIANVKGAYEQYDRTYFE